MTPCIEWTGHLQTSGYGQRSVGGKEKLVHRLAWEEANGPIPHGLCVLHRCDNRRCYNVDHLFLGTRADNNADMRAKGRARYGRGPRGGGSNGGGPRGSRNGRAKLTEALVADLRSRRAQGESTAQLAVTYGVTAGHIRKVVRGEQWLPT